MASGEEASRRCRMVSAKPDRTSPFGVGERVRPVELLADVVGDRRVQAGFVIGEPVGDGVGDPLRKQGPAVELQQPLLDRAPHQVRDLGGVNAVAEAPLEAVPVEQGQEELEVLLLAVVGSRRHQKEIAGQARQELRQPVPFGVLDLAPEEGRRQLVSLIAHDQVPIRVGGPQFLLHLFVTRELVQTADDEIRLQEPVVGPGGFEPVIGQDIEWQTGSGGRARPATVRRGCPDKRPGTAPDRRGRSVP